MHSAEHLQGRRACCIVKGMGRRSSRLLGTRPCRMGESTVCGGGIITHR